MPYDAFIFDLDGTLWDTAYPITEAWNIMLRELGINKKLTVKDIHACMGQPTQVWIERTAPELGDKIPSLVDTFEDEEKRQIQKLGGKMYEGVQKGIQALAEKRPVFLVSNCDTKYLKMFWEMSGLEPYMKDADCYGMSEVSKGQMLKNMREKHGLKNPVYIGDTETDFKATQEAGMDFVFMEHGFGHVDGAVKDFSSFPALVEWLLRG